MSVSTLPKVDAGSEFSKQSSSSSRSRATSDSLLGLAYYSDEVARSASNSSAKGQSHFTASSVDERLITGLEKLAFQAEQLSSKPPVDITIETSYYQKTMEKVEVEVPTFFGHRTVTEERWTSERKQNELEPQRLQSEHIRMPESSDSRFQ